MTHQWHDAYHHHQTPAHHLDPRSKLGVGLLFVGFVLFTPFIRGFQIAAYGALLLAAAWMAQIPLKNIFSRVGAMTPFVLLMMLSAVFSRLSAHHLVEIFSKSVLSISAMALLTMTTPFPDMLRALEQFRLPKLLILFLAFLYRYAAVLGKEAVRLERGWGSRYFGRFWISQWFKLGHILAALLIRSYERAERVYAAMLARGFSRASGFVRVLHFTTWDGVFVAVALSLFSAVRWVHL
jgi:cobalt/nickel transport system permease protein